MLLTGAEKDPKFDRRQDPPCWQRTRQGKSYETVYTQATTIGPVWRQPSLPIIGAAYGVDGTTQITD